jgi:hypothetical protein
VTRLRQAGSSGQARKMTTAVRDPTVVERRLST